MYFEGSLTEVHQIKGSVCMKLEQIHVYCRHKTQVAEATDNYMSVIQKDISCLQCYQVA